MGTVLQQQGDAVPLILQTVKRFWGYDRLRPLQAEAIAAGLSRRDSLVVMPTGGGKSLCYQVPAVLEGKTDVVISPLISLMKDQVDGLRECGYAAAALHTGVPAAERRRIEAKIESGCYRLVFAAPERMQNNHFLRLLDRVRVRSFAIDEAHCISHWGHDFRPEYRRLSSLKERFPTASVHGYTATATERVRRDILAQLRLVDPLVLVGTFDRPNLVYRVVPRTDSAVQIYDVVQRHAKQAVIVYCISRADAEYIAAALQSRGVRAKFYHAGMASEDRRWTQDAFAEESIDVVVATVAFGMGIDRSDVRCVIHAAMPKSIEHYQQETGRAGRDGLEAECLMLYSAADVIRWERLIRKSADAAGEDAAGVVQTMTGLLDHMRRYASSLQCRHRALSEYFGQAYQPRAGVETWASDSCDQRTVASAPDQVLTCGACDVCLQEFEGLEDATLTAQKILSCVARVQERFGVGHIVNVLQGANTDRVRQSGHDRLSTFGLLRDVDKKSLGNMVYQLIDQGLLDRTSDEFPVLKLNASSWDVMRKRRCVRLLKAKATTAKKTKFAETSWEGVDQNLFESLRELRRRIASERGMPAFLILNDSTLRDLARLRPSTQHALSRIRGFGEKKLNDLGARFLDHILDQCRALGLALDPTPQQSTSHPGSVMSPSVVDRNKTRARAFSLFHRRQAVETVMSQIDRARSTVIDYLLQFIEAERPESIDAWVDPGIIQTVRQAAIEAGGDRLKPIYEKLDKRVPYDTIRLILRYLTVIVEA